MIAVYLACNDVKNTDWNDNMYKCLSEEVIKLKTGYRVMFAGDFNGRIGNLEDGITDGDPVRNDNGDRLLDFASNHNFTILNREPLCSGKWTRTFRNQRSIIDYFLIENKHLPMAEKMNVYDDGSRDTGSDHN